MADFTLHETDWTHDASRLVVVRRTVFIEEQGIPEAMEWDEHDATALHILALTLSGTPIGCARLLTDGHLGRMAVLPSWRGVGIGKALLAALKHAAKVRGYSVLRLSAQTHAVGFYAAAGFEAVGAEYAEAGIPHVAMQLILT